MSTTSNSSSPVLDAIFKRRSVRDYTRDPIPLEKLHQIIDAGIWAPSGLNNQPWRFVVIQDQQYLLDLAKLTKYSHVVKNTTACIAVYLDTNAMYNEVKDHQAAGACIQNILLAAEALDLGAVWLGQILANKDKVNTLLGLKENHDLMAVIALGYPTHHNQKSTRHKRETFILKEI